MRRSRLAKACTGLTFALATLGVSAVPAESTGAVLQSAQKIRLPGNAAAPAQQDESFPSSTQNAELDSVSCTSAGFCVAIGDYTVDNKSGRQETMVATERDGTWRPASEIHVPIEAVACTGSGSCVGVGGDEVATEKRGVWGAARAIRLPADVLIAGGRPRTHLFTVSCPSAGNCAAAGTYTDRAERIQAIVTTQRRGSWGAAHRITPPANALTAPVLEHDELGSVACTSTGNCVAVGSYVDTTGDADPMAATETDGRWQAASEIGLPANPNAQPGRRFGGLDSVACPTAGNCVAVGWYLAMAPIAAPQAQGAQQEDQSADQEPIAATEQGGVWGTASTTPLPGDALGEPQDGALSSVACSGTSGECVAVGSYTNACSPETNTCQIDGTGAMALDTRLLGG